MLNVTIQPGEGGWGLFPQTTAFLLEMGRIFRAGLNSLRSDNGRLFPENPAHFKARSIRSEAPPALAGLDSHVQYDSQNPCTGLRT